MDVKSPEDRSKNMSAIRNRNTKPEIKLRKALFRIGLRFRVNYNLPGKPDIVFPGKKLAVFVDGCFWHCCPRCYREPDDNKEYWKKKIATNVKRDEKVNTILTEDGWNVLRFWEHEVKKDITRVVEIIINALNQTDKVVSKRIDYQVTKEKSLLVAEQKSQYNTNEKIKRNID